MMSPMSKSPTTALVKPTFQAIFLSSLSNIIAQAIQSHRKDIPFSIDWRPVLLFALYALLSTPPNVLWQQFLEDILPGRSPVPQPPPAHSTRSAKARNPSASSSDPPLNKRNTILKILLDQTFGAALNTIAFLAFSAYTRNQDGAFVTGYVRREFAGVMSAGLKLWPAVSVLCFTAVPVDQRVVVGSVAGMAWGVYLSLVAAG